MSPLPLFRHKPAPPLLDLLPWDRFVTEGVLANVDGALAGTFAFRGPDLDAATAEEIETLSATLDQLLTPLGDGWMIHLEAQRLPAPGYPPPGAFPDPFTAAVDHERRLAYEGEADPYHSAYFLTFTYRDPSPAGRTLARWLKRPAFDPAAETRRIERFDHQLGELKGLLGPHLRLRRLGSAEMLAYLYRCLTFRHHPLNIPDHPISLERVFGSGPLLLGRQVQFDDVHIVPVDVSGFPAAANAASLAFLNELARPYHAVWRFLPLDRQTARGAVERRRVHWSAASLKPSQVVARMLYGTAKTPEVDDRFGASMREELDEVLLYLEREETSAGYLTTTISTFDTHRPTAEGHARAIVAELRNRGFLARVETVNAGAAYLGSLPAVGCYNVRRPLVVNRTFIDLALTTSVWPGSPTHPSPPLAGQPAHLVAATRGSTPFFLSLAHGDVQHALVAGPTGAGKSVLVNFLIHQFFRFPDAQVLAIDKGWSLYAATLAAGGAHYPLSPDGEDGREPGLRFAPLARLETPAELQAASSWVQELLRLQAVALTPETVHQVDEALRLLKVAPNRTLGTFASKVQRLEIRQALAPYHGSGRLAHLFDGTASRLDQAPLQVFEMEDVLPLEERAVTPLLLHLFAEIERRLDGRPTLVVVEEALPYLGQTLWSERFASWLFQLRKANAGVVFVGQSLAAFLDSPLRHALLESCPTRIFLPNAAALQDGPAEAYRAFGLNRRQIQLIATATPKREYFCVTPEGSRLFELALSPAALTVYGLAGPQARRRVAALTREHGRGWLEALFLKQGEEGFVELLRRFHRNRATQASPLQGET